MAEQAHRELAWGVWHTAALPLMRKFPSLKSLTTPKADTPQATSAEAQIAAAVAWTQRLNAKK